MIESHDLARAALQYAERGWPVIPLHSFTARGCSCGQADCKSPAKHPRTTHGVKDASCDPAVISEWWTHWPDANIGIVTGPESGILVLDVDGKQGEESLVELKGRACHLPDTYTVRTGGGGQHLYFLWPEGADVHNSASKIAPGLDVRGRSGYVVAPPSAHASGARYEVNESAILPAAPCPDLVSLIQAAQSAQTRRNATAAGAVADEPIEKGRRTPILSSLIGKMIAQGVPEYGIKAAALALNRTFSLPHKETNIERMVADMVKRYLRDGSPKGEGPDKHGASTVRFQPGGPKAAETQATLNDNRPKVLLPGDDRLMSDVAAELGEHLADRLYVHNGEIATPEGDALHQVDAQAFRTLVEQTVVCCRHRTSRKEGVVKVDVTMTVEESRGILKSPQFQARLRQVTRINTVRLPVSRKDGSIELLPEGHDEATQTFTTSAVTYADDMTFPDALRVIQDLFAEFEFADGARSEAVSVAALVGLYAAQLVPEGELRPAFTYSKNAEGAGGTTAAACAIVPVLGCLPTGVKAGDDDEMRKVISTTIREGRPVLFLDNAKGHLNSGALEAFVSSPAWRDRLLGSNESVTGPNNVYVFVTGNGMTVSSDWRRRSLFIELHLSAERAEDRVFKRPLSVPVLQSLRSEILAACWSLVKNWEASGRPQPSRSHSAFSAWAGIIGGIVEAAGFACPLDTAASAVIADEDGAAMRALTEAMDSERRYTAQEVATLCRNLGVFMHLVGSSETAMEPSRRSSFGKVLVRYANRLVGNVRFVVEGQSHRRRYHVEQQKHGDMVRQGNSPEMPKHQESHLWG